MFISFKRILKFGWQGFWRNKGLSSQVIFVMAIVVVFGTSLFLFREISFLLIEEAQNKVDVAIYFKKEAPEESILAVQKELSDFKEKIKSVHYVSRVEALESFKQRHQGNKTYLTALEEVEDNPFLASLNIKAYTPEHYAFISNFLEEGIFRNLIERISYYENEKVINRLFALTSQVKTTGLIASLFLGLLVILITFNTVKLTILASREEIETMRLVGASNWFIRGPFLAQGVLYGIFAVLIVDVLLLILVFSFNTKLATWLLNFNVLAYFQNNLLAILLAQFASTVFLGIVSSYIAVRKYLKV